MNHDLVLDEYDVLVMPGQKWPEKIPLMKRVGGSWRYPRLCHIADAIVDSSDFPALSKFKWSLQKQMAKNGSKLQYAFRMEKQEGKIVKILMARQILGLLPGDSREAIHRNGDRLDCRRENLLVSPRGNHRNHLIKSRLEEGETMN